MTLILGGPALASATQGKSSSESPKKIELSLDDAVDLAKIGNSRVDRADRNAKIAELQVESARAAYYPRVDVAVAANQSARGSTLRSSDSTFRQGLVGNFRGGVSVSANVPLDVSGIIARRVRQSRIGETVAELERERAATEIVANTQIAYLQALKAQKATQLDQQVIGSIRSLLERATKDRQPVSPFLKIELANARQVLNARRGELEQAHDNLKRSLGLGPEVRLVLTSALPDIDTLKVVGRGTGDVSARDDLEVARKRLDQAELAVVQAGDQRRPSVRAGVYFDQFFGGKFVSDTGETSTRSVGLNLSLNLPILNYDAGQSGNNRKIAELRAEQARSDLGDAIRDAKYDLKQARAAWARALARIEALPSTRDSAAALSSAERNLLGASDDDAPSRLAQVSNARTAWRNAEAAAGDAAVDLAVAAIRMRLAEGRAIEAADLEEHGGAKSRRS